MSQELLHVKDLHISFKAKGKDVRAVTGVDFTVDKGQTMGIVGESGAGKSVLGLSILRLLPDTTAYIPQGSIEFKGNDLLKLSKKDMQKVRGDQISMIFQDPMTSLNPVMSVGDQIIEALRYHNKDKLNKAQLEQRVDEVMELVGIPAYRKKEYPHQFSGGMRQRVVIAIALVCNPELLIADEPTTALDVTIQAQVLAIIRDLQKKLGTAMVLITHDLGIVAQMCDKVGVMYAGEMVEHGSIEDIFSGDFHHPYTMGLFGSIPNLETESKRLSPIPGLMPPPNNLPEGCRFHPRCKHCMEICKTVAPEKYYDKEGHYVACHLFRDKGKEENHD